MNTRFQPFFIVLSVPLLILAGCAGMEGLFAKPEARIASIELESVTFDSVSLIVNIEIDNPNPLGLSLDAYDYGLDAWDSTIVEGRQEEKVSLKASGISMLPIPLTLDFADLLAVGGSAISAESIPLDIRLGLEIEIPYTGTARLDLSGSIEVPIPKAPMIVPTKLQVERITLFGAEISLLLDIENPNSFGMTIRGLDGQLYVGNQEWGNIGLSHSVNLTAGGREAAIVTLNISFAEVGASAISILKGSGRTDITIDGDMDVDMDIPGFNGTDLDWDADASVSIIR